MTMTTKPRNRVLTCAEAVKQNKKTAILWLELRDNIPICVCLKTAVYPWRVIPSGRRNTMSIKPISFNAASVQAILKGGKTQERRIVKGLDGLRAYRAEPSGDETYEQWDFLYGGALPGGGLFDAYQTIKAPYAVGDILWVRETWCAYYLPHGATVYAYRATDPNGNKRPTGTEYDDPWEISPWEPSNHMPKEAARIFLRVTEVLPELDMYMHCWVWVIKFERCEKPEK